MTSHPRKIRAIVARLLTWYSMNARDLPWRHTQEPYAIWVSEIMLQQTQVKTVIPYWNRWMKSLPDIRALARATPERVLKLWEGLGYYSRARNLQKAAKQLCGNHAGKFPTRFEEVLELPGIGRYTAGAICSIAYNQPTPVLDGNTVRVLCRLFGIDRAPHLKEVNRQLWTLAEGLVVSSSRLECIPTRLPHVRLAGNCSRLNQAIMELGAVQCLPRQPRCSACPVGTLCVAARSGTVEKLPRAKARAQTTNRRFIAFIVCKGNRVLGRQRPINDVNGGYWEFPNIEMGPNGQEPNEAARHVFKATPRKVKFLARVKHTIMQSRITLDAYEASFRKMPEQLPDGSRWIGRAALVRLPFASAHRKIAQRLLEKKSCGS